MSATSRGQRIHIGLFGKCNSGKSSLINAITGQTTAIVSDVPGTTADPVAKSMELPGVGPVVFIDTAGFGDAGELGAARTGATMKAVKKTDIALLLFEAAEIQNSDETAAPLTEEKRWAAMFTGNGIPVIAVLNKSDTVCDTDHTASQAEALTGLKPITVSAKTGEGIDALLGAIARVADALGERDPASITGDLASAGDVVLLVMPQDAQAPKGRLILPQAQIIRELMDKGCITICCAPDRMADALKSLTAPPKLVITDSQAFAEVSRLTPPESKLTSFSVLFANYKGDIGAFVEGAAAIDRLTEKSRVLIAEACTHAPLTEDIGRVKIPRMLRSRVGEGIGIDIVAGSDFPDDLAPYDLVIQCGGCMFNRRHILSRVAQAREQGVPITNYGIVIAHIAGILDKIVYPSAK